MLSPSPSSTGCSPARSKSVSVICSATDFSPNALHLVAVGASDGESGVSWMEDVEEKGGGGISRQLRTVVVSVPAGGGEGWAGWVAISLHRKGEKFGGLSCCVLSLSGGSEGIQLCAFCSRVCFVNCCRQRKVSGLADGGG